MENIKSQYTHFQLPSSAQRRKVRPVHQGDLPEDRSLRLVSPVVTVSVTEFSREEAGGRRVHRLGPGGERGRRLGDSRRREVHDQISLSSRPWHPPPRPLAGPGPPPGHQHLLAVRPLLPWRRIQCDSHQPRQLHCWRVSQVRTLEKFNFVNVHKNNFAVNWSLAY